MKRIGFIVCILVLLVYGLGWSAEVDLKWDQVPGATGYRIFQSVDSGTTWTILAEAVITPQYTALAVPEDRLVLFRISAYNASTEGIRYWSGAWWDSRLKPVTAPGGASIQ